MTHIPLIMDRLDNIIFEDKLRRFSNAIIVKIIVILEIYGISYRSLGRFFSNHPELMNLLRTKRIPDFRTPLYRALRMDWHGRNAAIDGFIVKTCKDSIAQGRRSGKYKDPGSS